MPDYVYLLENRLSPDQRNALRHLREVAREAGTILFLTGDAVRDLTSGHAVRSLEVVIHGNAFKLKKVIEKSGGKIWGEHEPSHTLYLCFPGTVRVDLVSAHSANYSKPGRISYHAASIQEDLRRRDFTVNAMAISLNEGSYGLLMDPLNGAADIEARTLRLVSNYGFLEAPELLIRATRYRTRLGWELDPRTQTRYENAKAENVIANLSSHARGEELEQIGHEEDALRVLEALEAEGWMNVLYPSWTAAKADVEGLKALHDQAVELLLQDVHPDTSAAQMQLLTAKLGSKDVSALKKLFIRPGFVEEWNSLDSLAAGFAKALTAKDKQAPSAIFKLFHSYDPEAILWLGFTSKDSAIKERFNLFLKVWPEARQRIPYSLMQEMRITPELAGYKELVESIFLELIDGRLTTPEEMRAFLEPHSPPAPPPQVTIKRSRARRGAEAKLKERDFDDEEAEEDEEMGGKDLEEIDHDGDDLGLDIAVGEGDLGEDEEKGRDHEEEVEDEEVEEEPVPAPRSSSKAASKAKPGKAAPAPLASQPAKPAPAPVAVPKVEKPVSQPAAVQGATKTGPRQAPPAAKAAPTKQAAPSPANPKTAAPAKPIPAKAGSAVASKPAPKPAVKVPQKSATKSSAKPALKVASKAVPAKKAVASGKSANAQKPAKAAKQPAKKAAPKPSAKPVKKR